MTTALTKSRYLSFLLLVSLICLMTYIWVWGLEDFYFCLDNALHLVLAKQAGWKVIEHLQREPHPPLFYFFLKLWIEIFGTSNPLLLRSFSLFSGVMAVLVSFFLGRKLSGSPWVGFLAAFLLVTSPLFISVSQALRNYSLLVFLILAGFHCLQEEKMEIRHWIGLGLVIFLITLTHYSSVLLLPSFLFLGFSKASSELPKKRKIFYQTLWFLFLVANALLTYWMVMVRPESISGADTHILSLKTVVGKNFFKIGPVLWDFLKVFFGDYVIWIVVCLGGGGVIRLILDRKKNSLIVTLGPLLMGIIFSLANKYPLTSERHSIYLVPSFLLAVMWGTKWAFEKSSLSLWIILSAILVAQVSSNFSVYKVLQERERSFTELGPRISELRQVRAKLMHSEQDQTIIFDGTFDVSIWMEKVLKPEWAIFIGLPQRLEGCSIWFGIDEPRGRLCSTIQKLNKESSRNKFLLFLRKEQLQSFKKYALQDTGCYKNLGEQELSTNFVLVSVSPLSN